MREWRINHPSYSNEIEGEETTCVTRCYYSTCLEGEGTVKGRCGGNKSSFRLGMCQDITEPVPLCLTLKVFDLQRRDPAAGS